jgi:hypothetical protein
MPLDATMPPEALLRPLSVDVIYFLLPLLVGLGAFFVGRLFNRWPAAVRGALVALTVGAIFVVLALLFQAIPRPIELAFSYVGGVIIVLCWMILGVIGFSWSAPNPTSDVFARIFLALMPIGLIAIESGGSLWFRIFNTDPWLNRPTSNMVQTTKMTCLPVCAAMLMYEYNLVDLNKDDCSEGEFAYLANTSYFGSDGHTIARVITQKIDKRGVQAKMIMSTYEDMVARNKPFIAEVQLAKIGKHAVLVKTPIKKHELIWVDPFYGKTQIKTAEDFQLVWTGNAIVLDGDGIAPRE